MDVGDLLHHRPGQLVGAVGGPVGERRQGAAQLAVAIGLGEFASQAFRLAALQFGIAVAQHEMGKIEIERMRRHVGAFGHEAHVAERAGLHHRGEIRALYALDLTAGRGIHQIEQPGKTVAEIEAAPAAVADVEDPAHLFVELHRIGEIRIQPGKRVAGRRVETAFGHRDRISMQATPAAALPGREAEKSRTRARVVLARGRP